MEYKLNLSYARCIQTSSPMLGACMERGPAGLRLMAEEMRPVEDGTCTSTHTIACTNMKT